MHVIVEDDPEIAELHRLFVEQHGYRVAIAHDGLDALRWLQASPTPGLILSDLQMPGVDGWELRRKLLTDPTLARVPFVLLSACDVAPASAQSLAITACLHKPFELSELLAILEAHLARPGDERSKPRGP